MASLKTTGRQIAQPNAPDLRQAGAPYEAISNAVSGVGKVVGGIVEKKRKAALEMEATYNTLTGQREINRNIMRFKQQPNVSEADLEGFNKANQSISDEILKNTSEENLSSVTKSLFKYSMKAEVSAFGHVNESTNRQMKESGALALYEGAKQLNEYARNGEEENFTSTYYQVLKSQDALVEAGFISPEQYAKDKDELLQIGINGKLQHDYLKALDKGEREGAKFIEDFYKTETNMTSEQKDKALQSIVAIRAQERTANQQIGQAGFRDVMDFITSPNAPKTEGELDAFIQASAERGYPLNEYQEYKAVQAWRKTQKTNNKRAEKNIEISKLNATGDVNGLINQSSTDLDNWYIDTKKYVSEQVAQEAQEQESLSGKVMGQRPEWMIGASIAAQTPVPISQWQDEISSQLGSKNVDDILSAVSAYNYVASQDKRAVKGISEKDKSFIQAVTNDLERTTLTPQEIIEKYRDSILNVDPKVKENREAAYKDIIKNNPSLPQDIAKKAFGTKIGNTLKQPSAELYAAAQGAFEREYSLSGDKNQAVKNVVDYLKDNGGESVFAPSSEPVWNPPENLPFYDFGNIVRNQATKYLKESVLQAQKNPSKLPYSVEWSKKMPEFPDSVSEEDMFKGKYDKGEWWLNINGTDRRVYFISPNYNQANSFAETQYQVMFEKDGYLHNLLTITPTLNNSGEVVTGAGNSLMTFKSPDQLTPNLVAKMQRESAQGAKNKYIEKQTAFPSGFFEPDVSDVQEYLEKHGTEEKKKKAIKVIEEQNKDIGTKIEREKLRRQQAKTEQIIKGGQ